MNGLLAGLIGLTLGCGFMHFVALRPLRKIDREIMEARAEIEKTRAEIMELDAQVEAEIDRIMRETRN